MDEWIKAIIFGCWNVLLFLIGWYLGKLNRK
jgi:putative Mn2+ efflux pump MntP